MKATNTYERKAFSAKLIIFLYLALGFYSCLSQSFQRITHTGVEVSAGARGFKPATGSTQKLQPLAKGFAAGFVTGNNLMKLRVRPIGVYKSTGAAERPFEILESEAVLNVYPLEFIRTRRQVIDIYISTGINFNKYRFSDRDVFIQGSADGVDAEFMFLDKVNVISQVGGIGIEYHLPFSFVHVFTEASFSNSMYLTTANDKFRETLKQSSTSINFGIRIGTKRTVRNNKNYPG